MIFDEFLDFISSPNRMRMTAVYQPTVIRAPINTSGSATEGMGRFPVTLYKEQWFKLLGLSDDIRAFIAANDGQLKTKG